MAETLAVVTTAMDGPAAQKARASPCTRASPPHCTAPRWPRTPPTRCPMAGTPVHTSRRCSPAEAPLAAPAARSSRCSWSCRPTGRGCTSLLPRPCRSRLRHTGEAGRRRRCRPPRQPRRRLRTRPSAGRSWSRLPQTCCWRTASTQHSRMSVRPGTAGRTAWHKAHRRAPASRQECRSRRRWCCPTPCTDGSCC